MSTFVTNVSEYNNVTQTVSNNEPIVAASWYIICVTGSLLLLFCTVVLVRSLYVRYKNF